MESANRREGEHMTTFRTPPATGASAPRPPAGETMIETTFRSRTPTSAAMAERAMRTMPGGDTRTAAHHPPYALTLDRGEGTFVWDVDGNRYIDVLGNYTSLVHGHCYPPIMDAVSDQLRRGTAWPARNEPHVALSELLVDRIASIEQLRFANSGTEATMLALYIARRVTGRYDVLMASGGYHGSLDEFELGTMGQEGPHTHLATFGDAESFRSVLRQKGSRIAAVVLEPVIGSGGVVAAPPGFLREVQDAAHEAGALFIVDEVITLRLHEGGAQADHNIDPDLTAMGKIIGGGFPVGAVGGKADLLAVTHPERPRLLHSGTFNGNPVTATAGLVSMQHLTGEHIGMMSHLAGLLAEGIALLAKRADLPCTIRHEGSILQVFCDAPELAVPFHLAALNHGVFFAPRA